MVPVCLQVNVYHWDCLSSPPKQEIAERSSSEELPNISPVPLAIFPTTKGFSLHKVVA